MNEEEARSALAQEMEHYRAMSYSSLVSMLDETKHIEATGSSGASYQIDISVMWDEKSNGTLRIIGAIDDGGWSAFLPLSDDFLLRPDGTLL